MFNEPLLALASAQEDLRKVGRIINNAYPSKVIVIRGGRVAYTIEREMTCKLCVGDQIYFENYESSEELYPDNNLNIEVELTGDAIGLEVLSVEDDFVLEVGLLWG